MMTNMFSTFDPSSSVLSMSWMILIMSVSILSPIMWKNEHSSVIIIKKMVNILYKETNSLLKSKEKSTKAIPLTVFVLLVMLNVSGLYPYSLPATSHLTVTLPLSLMFWLTIILFGWFKNTKIMLIHLVPQGTPTSLMMFMVIIELISNIIRPITLCVRVTANLVAGHLLLSILGSMLLSSSCMAYVPITLALLVLTSLEYAVALIQAYVFMTLINLYLAEVK